MKNKMIVWQAVLLGLGVMTGGTALADVVDVQIVGVAALTVAALNAGTQYYIAQTRTENGAVVSYQGKDGTIRAGEASVIPTDAPLAVAPDPLTGQSVALMPLVSPVQPDTPAM